MKHGRARNRQLSTRLPDHQTTTHPPNALAQAPSMPARSILSPEPGVLAPRHLTPLLVPFPATCCLLKATLPSPPRAAAARVQCTAASRLSLGCARAQPHLRRETCLEPSRSETVMATPVSSYSSRTFLPLTRASVAMSRACSEGMADGVEG